MKFSKHWTIDQAYQHLTSSVERVVIQTGDLAQLQRACVRKIKGLGSNLPRKLIPLIEDTSSVNGLLDTLTQSEYWNWFDTRLLEAVTHASGSPEAVKLLDHFRKTYYNTKVSDLVLYNIEVKPFKNFVTIVEKYNKDPNKLTILDLQKHQYELEQVLDGGLVLLTIKTGCVELTWQILPELVLRIYTSMKRKQDELSLLAVKSLVCEEANRYAGLPILWRGHEVGVVGPIEPLPEHVKQEPYSLPQGFQWVTLSNGDFENVAKLMNKAMTFNPSRFSYIMTYPNTRTEWQFGIRTTNGDLVGVVMVYPVCMNIGGVSVMCVCPIVQFHEYYFNKPIFYMLNKELQRRTNLRKINQFICLSDADLPKPVSTNSMWYYKFTHPASYILPNSPRTPGWRKMTSEDVPSALALVNKYSSQFEIRQIFTSEEEFSHYFLFPAVPNFVRTYVVENESNNITDLVRCFVERRDDGQLMALITTMASTHCPVRQLIRDVMVCVRNSGAESVAVKQQSVSRVDLSSLFFHLLSVSYCYFYNYKYHEIPESNLWYSV